MQTLAFHDHVESFSDLTPFFTYDVSYFILDAVLVPNCGYVRIHLFLIGAETDYVLDKGVS